MELITKYASKFQEISNKLGEDRAHLISIADITKTLVLLQSKHQPKHHFDDLLFEVIRCFADFYDEKTVEQLLFIDE